MKQGNRNTSLGYKASGFDKDSGSNLGTTVVLRPGEKGQVVNFRGLEPKMVTCFLWSQETSGVRQDAHAEITWGSGGTVHSAEVDVKRGTSFRVNAAVLEVVMVNDGDEDGNIPHRYGGMVGEGIPSGDDITTRTVTSALIGVGALGNVTIPNMAKWVRAYATGGAGFVSPFSVNLDFLDNLGGLAGAFGLERAMNIKGYIPNNANEIRVGNFSAAPATIVFIFGLAL